MKYSKLIDRLQLAQMRKKTIIIGSIALFFAVQIIFSNISYRLDFSANRAYTLSESTKSILRNLNKPVTIRFYVSSEIPQELAPLRTEVTDLLREFELNGGSKLSVEKRDPADDAVRSEAIAKGIPELQFSQVQQDAYALTNAFFGIALEQNGKTEVIPQVTDIESLEYNLTSAIYKLNSEELPKVAVVGMSPTFGAGQDELSALRSVLDRQTNLTYIDIASGSAVVSEKPLHNAMLLFAQPFTSYSSEEAALIETYLESGGNVVVFADGVWVDETMNAQPSQNGLDLLLSKYGLLLRPNLILSASAELVNFGNGGVSYFLPYPYWFRASTFTHTPAYFSNVNQLTFPWASSIRTEPREGYEARALVTTPDQSWAQSTDFTLAPTDIAKPSLEDLQPYTVAAESKNKYGGSLLLIGSSRFVSTSYLSRTSGNIAFISNVVSTLASDGKLAGIRSRSVAFYPIPPMDTQSRTFFKIGVVAVLPLLYALYGAFILLRKK